MRGLLHVEKIVAEYFGDSGGGFKACFGLLRQQAVDDRHQPVGDVGIGFPDRPGRVLADAMDRGGDARGSERGTPRAHRVQHRPQTEQIAAVVDGFVAGLFRRHVLGSSGDDAGLGNFGIVRGAGEAKVGELDAFDAVFQQDVAGFHVPVNDALGVGGGQSRSGLHPDPQDFFDLQRAHLSNAFFQRRADDILHDEIWQSIRLADGMNGDHVVVGHRGGLLSLAQKPLSRRTVGGKFGPEHLDRDDPVQRGILGPQHHSHAAAAHDTQNVVAADPAQRLRTTRRLQEIEPRIAGRGTIASARLHREFRRGV